MVKINATTFRRMEEVTRSRLHRGVLHVDLTPGPKPCSAGHQPLFSRPHFTHGRPAVPMLLQFSPEILKCIFEYLEPIWLFQVAAAFPEIDGILDFEISNRIWYDAIPAALFLEPDHFQDEALVKDRMLAFSKGADPDATLRLSSQPFLVDAFHYHTLHSLRFIVPAITNMSQLSCNLSFDNDTVHPQDRRFYPTTPTRVRVMALGGPFQPWLDYKQELAGHLHCGMRCYICFVVVGRVRPYKKIWGMNWCSECYDVYVLSEDQIRGIPGLADFIRGYPHYSTVRLTVKPRHCEYRPMVDEMLRMRIGLDFHTAYQVQQYIRQLLDMSKGGRSSEGLRDNRRDLRVAIVTRAQEIWGRTVLDGQEEILIHTGDIEARKQAVERLVMVGSRQRWAPTSMLAGYLFPARLLCASQLWLPHEIDAKWLADPTLQLETSRDVVRADAGWVEGKAREMLQRLVSFRSRDEVTTWCKAAEQWHVRRLKLDLAFGKYLNFDLGGARLDRLADVAARDLNRLDVMAKKLRLDPLFPVGRLRDDEMKRAVACFNKIIRQRCSGCPDSNNTVAFQGLEAVVHHHRRQFPSSFYLDNSWTIRG